MVIFINIFVKIKFVDLNGRLVNFIKMKKVKTSKKSTKKPLKKISKGAKVLKKAKHPRILLVEDDSATRESVLIKLERSGFKVDFAADGKSGLKKLREDGPFSAVLLDLVMPNGDGFKFLQEKKDDKKIKDILTIVFTNLSQKENVKRAAEYGAHGYIVKAHHSLSEIIEKLNRCLKDSKQCPMDYSELEK